MSKLELNLNQLKPVGRLFIFNSGSVGDESLKGSKKVVNARYFQTPTLKLLLF